MMINRRLIETVPESKRHIAGNVIAQWISLAANIVMVFTIGWILEALLERRWETGAFWGWGIILLLGLLVRFICARIASRESFLASKSVKQRLRQMIYGKLLRLGSRYTEKAATAEIVQASVEGVEQLETYFGSYLPQFFYSMMAPITLFIVLSFVNLPSAVVLLICVPLIPVSIIAVQKFAKKLLAKYWGQYTRMGDHFLENLQGLTTLKIYQTDGQKHREMNEEAERFRKITMKVLTMQLNSITIMDLIAYGGAALGVVVSVSQFAAGHMGFWGTFVIILLAADFFLPLRALGSFFHVAMNGMAASDRIFWLLDLPEDSEKTETVGEATDLELKDVSYSYDGEREALTHVNMRFSGHGLTSIVGESGCGKSTVASLIMGLRTGYSGSILVGGKEAADLQEESRMRHMTSMSMGSYIFKGTIRENLAMGCKDASEETMWRVLGQVNLAGFVRENGGLDMVLLERGSNLSGGQCQRLALARALLHDSQIYIFDEATSNIDAESENDIMEVLRDLAKRKNVILISHRLANVAPSEKIYVMEAGRVIEQGRHEELLKNGGHYARMWNVQADLENYDGKGSVA